MVVLPVLVRFDRVEVLFNRFGGLPAPRFLKRGRNSRNRALAKREKARARRDTQIRPGIEASCRRRQFEFLSVEKHGTTPSSLVIVDLTKPVAGPQGSTIET
jgi:hypothetical protein